MKRRIVAGLAVLSMVAGLTAGCGGESGAAKGSGKENVSEKKTEGSSEASGEKIKLTGLVHKSGQNISVNDMGWMDTAMENANVEIEWQEVTTDDWGSVRGPLLSSGDIPDIIIGAHAINAPDVITFKGLFKDLTPYLDDMPNVQRMFEEVPKSKVMATSEDGKIYGIPKYMNFKPQVGSRQYINKQWLDALGLEIPETLEELTTVLKAFAEQDPNGNGEADEIPFSFDNGEHIDGNLVPYNFMHSYGNIISSLNTGYYVDDGVVKNYFLEDEFKELAKLMHQWYKDGIIHSAAFTNDSSSYIANARGKEDVGEATYGFFIAWSRGDIVGEKLKDQYVAIPPLKATADQTEQPLWGYDKEGAYRYGAALVSENCKNPEAAVRFIDALYDPEMSISIQFGEVGKLVEKNEDGSYRVLPPAEAGDTEGSNPGLWNWKMTMCDLGPGYLTDSVKVEYDTDLEEILGESEPYDAALATVDVEKNFLHGAFLRFTEEERNELSVIDTEIKLVQESTFSEWVVNGGIDEGWETFQSSLKNAGIERGIELNQIALDNYFKENESN